MPAPRRFKEHYSCDAEQHMPPAKSHMDKGIVGFSTEDQAGMMTGRLAFYVPHESMER
jgi:hypothetical protein